MPDGAEPVTVNLLGAIDEVSAEAWDACAGAGNPFVSHGFLNALERSGSATADSHRTDNGPVHENGYASTPPTRSW